MNEQGNGLGQFFAVDPRGKQLPGYLTNLAAHLAQEQTAMQTPKASRFLNQAAPETEPFPILCTQPASS